MRGLRSLLGDHKGVCGKGGRSDEGMFGLLTTGSVGQQQATYSSVFNKAR